MDSKEIKESLSYISQTAYNISVNSGSIVESTANLHDLLFKVHSDAAEEFFKEQESLESSNVSLVKDKKVSKKIIKK